MMCLRSISGLPLDIDLEMERLMIDNAELDCSESKNIPLNEISPGLLNKSLRYPENVYTQHRQVQRKQDSTVFQGRKLNYDINFIPSCLLGIEYAKTQVYCLACDKQDRAASFVEVLSGVLTVYLQRDSDKKDPYELYPKVVDAKLVEMKEGDKLAIPCNYMYTFINTHDLPVVYSRVLEHEHIVDQQVLTKRNGLAYYLISKNARREVVSNPRYREVPPLQEVAVENFNTTFNYQPPQKPLYEDLLQNMNVYMQAA